MDTPSGRRVLTELVNEFAAVRVSLDVSGNGPRLLVEDLDGSERLQLQHKQGPDSGRTTSAGYR
ncbi:hypothetical protein ACKUT9_22685 [Mycobacterium seoulense]|uniref:hypothetical protein n=1 Tax=Mycobacterium seoulense TaxID=386911 RepID=UPI003CF636BB